MNSLNPSEQNATALLNGGGHATSRILVVAIAAVLIVGGASAWRIGANSAVDTNQLAQLSQPPRNPAIDQLVENTKALESSQQQAVDQLQVVQDMLTTQQTEMKRASDRVAVLNGKLDALQQSFASIPPPAAEEPAVQPSPKVRIKSNARSRAHRGAGPRKTARAKKQRTASRK